MAIETVEKKSKVVDSKSSSTAVTYEGANSQVTTTMVTEPIHFESSNVTTNGNKVEECVYFDSSDHESVGWNGKFVYEQPHVISNNISSTSVHEMSFIGGDQRDNKTLGMFFY